eukprot:TRINITY_DN1354_c2_g2_i1.p1 TRINITY_DN1354_c2_g2~~TRINITY_DN1354_c2_g2_i1.p1  ORF type:complete len:159 (+),score=25.84 TRINITY_DN1354_c2_g2_i1:193-669(+)
MASSRSCSGVAWAGILCVAAVLVVPTDCLRKPELQGNRHDRVPRFLPSMLASLIAKKNTTSEDADFCNTDEMIGQLGCRVGCHCGFFTDCYPMHIRSDGAPPWAASASKHMSEGHSWLDVGRCDVSQVMLIVLSLLIIATIFMGCVKLRMYLLLGECW